MQSIPLIRVSSFLPVIKFLNQIGSPTHRLLKQANLSAFALDQPHGLIPLYLGFSFVEAAARVEKIDLLGLEVSRQTQVSDLGALGHLIQQTFSLYDMLCTLQRVIHLNNSCAKVWVTEELDYVWLHHQFDCSPALQSQQAQLFTLLNLIKAVQLAAGPAWKPVALRLQASASRQLTETEELADVPLYFNQGTNAIAIPKSLLAQPLQSSRPAHSLSLQECYHHLQTTAPSPDFSGSLQQVLQSLLKHGYPDIRLAAAAAGNSVRSFQRRLSKSNLSYSRMVERVRFDQAIHLLQNSDMQLIDIAMELGYSDAANFTRAFKRWTGISPREFRQRACHVFHQ